MSYPLTEWVNGLVNRNLRAKNHLLLQLEEIKFSINTLQTRKKNCTEVIYLAQGHGVVNVGTGTRTGFSTPELVSMAKRYRENDLQVFGEESCAILPWPKTVSKKWFLLARVEVLSRKTLLSDLSHQTQLRLRNRGIPASYRIKSLSEAQATGCCISTQDQDAEFLTTAEAHEPFIRITQY